MKQLHKSTLVIDRAHGDDTDEGNRRKESPGDTGRGTCLKNLYAKEKLRFDYNERMFEVGGMNGLASSLMLLDEFLERQRKKLGDDLVIHVPNRETLLFFRKSDRQLTLNVMSAIISGDIPCLLDEFLFEYDGRLREFSPSGVRRPN